MANYRHQAAGASKTFLPRIDYKSYVLYGLQAIFLTFIDIFLAI
ncbi:MAG: hypothetical protein Q8Q59_02010 [Luteolibacter sp.]|nr:hypothetical protein [Luteolibacter sp.]